MTTAVTKVPRTGGAAREASDAGPPRRERGPSDAPRWQIYFPLGVYLLFTLVPFYWMLLFALRPSGSTSLLPWPATTEHFAKVWNDLGFALYFGNSLIIGVVVLCTTSFVALLGGYALARFRFRGKGTFLLALLCSQFIPGALMLVPLFQIFANLRMIDSLLSVIVADTVFQLPLSLILIGGFIRNIPVSLEEAAWLDGCGRIRAFCAVVLPLLRPGLIAVGSFAFVSSWNNFLFALMFLSSQDRYTIPVGLNYLIDSGESVDLGSLAAGGVMAAVPVVIVFAFIQKWLITGFSAGAVKG